MEDEEEGEEESSMAWISDFFSANVCNVCVSKLSKQLPNNKSLDFSELKAFADDKFNATENINLIF